MNVAKIESSLKELADKPFNPSEFHFEFLAAYDVPKVRSQSFAEHPNRPARRVGPIPRKKKLLYRTAAVG